MLMPAQPVGEGYMAEIHVVERGPEPGWEGNTVHLRLRVVHIATGDLWREETFGPLHADPLERGLTDEDAHELARRIDAIDRMLRAAAT